MFGLDERSAIKTLPEKRFVSQQRAADLGRPRSCNQ
jgi:hypothetical protein